MSLKYKKLSSSELVLGQEVLEWLLSDDEIMEAVDRFHRAGTRCAVVVWMEDDDVDDAYISDEMAIKEEFDLPRIRKEVSSYDTNRTFCVLLVRDGSDAVVLQTDTQFSG